MVKGKSSVSVLATSVPTQSGESEEVSVSVRQIENGFIKRTTRYASGVYESKEEFSKNKPELDMGSSAPRMSGSLKRAIEGLK